MAHASDSQDRTPDDRVWLDILQHNIGFTDPSVWTAYARERNFRRVNAERITECPDCGTPPTKPAWSQYVYYSTLFRLHNCAICRLTWADVRLAPEEIQRHFESAYKDDTYFRVQRSAIFHHTANVISSCLPPEGTVLDIGGARGDLMACLVDKRPDAHVTVHDLSVAATEYARETFGFETIAGSLPTLADHATQYDVVVLSDVLYYEPDLRQFWSVLDRLVAPGGSVILRVPNKYELIRAWQFFSFDVRGAARRAQQDHLRFFNPEHISILRKDYLASRLRKLGFSAVTAMPSPPLGVQTSINMRSLSFHFARAVSALSGGGVITTPAMLLVGRRNRA